MNEFGHYFPNYFHLLNNYVFSGVANSFGGKGKLVKKI